MLAYGTPIVTKTTTYTILRSDFMILADATAGAFNVTLPSATVYAQQIYGVKKIDSSANAVTVVGTIDGATNLVLSNQYDVAWFQNDGTNWWKVVPLASGSFATLTGVQTLTNKRITKRVLALSANSATPAINTDSYDTVHITAQTAAITSFTSGLSGTPVDGDKLLISITGTASVALTWGASFESSTTTLPTTTSSTTRLDIGFLWNSDTSAWRCVAVA